MDLHSFCTEKRVNPHVKIYEWKFILTHFPLEPRNNSNAENTLPINTVAHREFSSLFYTHGGLKSLHDILGEFSHPYHQFIQRYVSVRFWRYCIALLVVYPLSYHAELLKKKSFVDQIAYQLCILWQVEYFTFIGALLPQDLHWTSTLTEMVWYMLSLLKYN